MKGRINASFSLHHVTTITMSPLSALVNLITSLNPFLLTIFGGTLLKGRPVSSILKIRHALSRITIFRTDFCTDQNNRQQLYDCPCVIALYKPFFSVQCLDFSGNVKTSPCPHTFYVYTKDNLYLSHQQTRISLNGYAQECIQNLFLLNPSTWQHNLVFLTR